MAPPASNGVRVSVAVCTRNRCESLRRTLQALARVNVPADFACELIIVDNGSSDRTAEVVQTSVVPGMEIRYIYESRPGQCYARNTALAAAQGDIILFTDDDVQPPPNWVEGMCAPIRSGQAEAVAGGVKIAPDLERRWMTPALRRWLASTEEYVEKGPSQMVGANCGFSKQVLSKVPAFDTELGPGALGFYDETLFSFQLSEAGYRLATAFDVAVEHHFDESRLSRRGFLESAKKKGRSSAYVAHHWRHIAIRAPYLRLAGASLRLIKARVKRRKECLLSEGVPEWEMERVEGVYFYEQYLVERIRPRNYAKHGLVKLEQPILGSVPGRAQPLSPRAKARVGESRRRPLAATYWLVMGRLTILLLELAEYFATRSWRR